MHHAAGKLGVPSVLHVRGPMSDRDIRKHKVARADGVIAIAQRYHNDLVSAGVAPGRLEVIDDAVDLERFRPGLAGREYLQGRFGVDGELFVGLVGRVDPFKRVLEFLQAVAPLANSYGRRVKYLIVGQPGRKSYYQKVLDAVRSLGLREHVVLTDHEEDIAETIAALDILVTMSGGSVMFEAMACATPVLSVRTDGRHSVHTRHDDTAWCVTTDRPEPVTSGLAKLIDESDLRLRLSQAGRTWAQGHLSTATMAARTQGLYERLF
jgi:glycosyltransferase involved in cell wall biosynthesis